MSHPSREIDLAPLRNAYLRSGLTAAEVGRNLGWLRSGRTCADVDRVRRQFGLIPYSPGRNRPSKLRTHCSYERALQLAAAIGADPVDVGL